MRPAAGEQFDHFTDAAHVRLARAEIPRPGKLRALLIQAGSQLQIAGQRFQRVLPWAHRLRIAQGHGFIRRPRPQHVGNQPLRGEIATTEHVAGARRGQRQTVLGVLLRRKERGGIGLCE
ncbi:hypothetical protein D9M71_756620 [compost metagenome]